jgi:hypothetical protein
MFITLGIDELFPDDIQYTDLGNLRTCMKSTGKLLLDAYYNLNKLEPSIVDIEKFTPYLECANFMLQKLFCYKQRLYGSSKKNTVALKPHMVLHFPSNILYFGCIKNFDSAVVEFMHKDNAKIPYKQSSKRSETILEEMTARIDQVQLTNLLVERTIKVQFPAKLTHASTIKYTTEPPENITFEGLKSSFYRVKLDYIRNNDTVYSQYCKSMSPHTTLKYIWNLVANLDYPATRRVVNGIKAGHKGFSKCL